MSEPTATHDSTQHTRLIRLHGAPDVFTKWGRGGGYFSPYLMRVRWDNDGPRSVWIEGIKRKKDGELGQQDTGEMFYVDEPASIGGHLEPAPAWALEIICRTP